LLKTFTFVGFVGQPGPEHELPSSTTRLNAKRRSRSRSPNVCVGRWRASGSHQQWQITALKSDGDNGYYITPLVEILKSVARKEKKVAEMTGQKFDGEADHRRGPGSRPTAS